MAALATAPEVKRRRAALRTESVMPTGPLSLDALRRVGEEAMAGGLLPHQAADAVLGRYQPDAEAAAFLIRLGLIDDYNRLSGAYNRAWPDQANESDFGRGSRSVVKPGRFQANRHEHTGLRHINFAQVLFHIRLRGADGTKKRVIEFTIADCRSWGDFAKSEALAFQRRRMVMEKAVEKMEARGVITIGKLPKEDLAELNAEFGRVWK